MKTHRLDVLVMCYHNEGQIGCFKHLYNDMIEMTGVMFVWMDYINLQT